MIKLFHGHTNYNKLIFRCSYRPKQYKYMDDILTVEPLGGGAYRLSFKNDVIEFHVDVEHEIVIPLRMTNIIEDLDQFTFVSGTKIQKRYAMVQADERLYRLCQHYIFELGIEII